MTLNLLEKLTLAGFTYEPVTPIDGTWKGPCDKCPSIWMDGPYGYLFYYYKEPCLLVSYQPQARTFVVVQAQCVQKKGNRWIWKLPAHPGKPVHFGVSFLEAKHTYARVYAVDADWVIFNVQFIDRMGNTHPTTRWPLTDEQKARLKRNYNV